MPRHLRTLSLYTLRETARTSRLSRLELQIEHRRNLQVTITLKPTVEHLRRLRPERLPSERYRARYFRLFQYHHIYEMSRHFKMLSEYVEDVETEIPTISKRPMRRFSILFERERQITEGLEETIARAKPSFRPMLSIIHSYLLRMLSIDMCLANLAETIREAIIERLIEVERGNPLYAYEVQQQPLLRHYAKRFIGYYMSYPETHNIYAMKLTPFTLARLEGKSLQFYALRVFSANSLKLSSIAGYARRAAFRIMRYVTKGFYEVVNAMCYIGSTGSSRYDKIATSLDDMNNPMFQRRIYELVYRPHELKRWCAKSLGFPELHDEITRVGILANERKSRVSKLYDYNAYKRLVMDLKRRKVHETLSLNTI